MNGCVRVSCGKIPSMTAKQELQDIVHDLNDGEATVLLGQAKTLIAERKRPDEEPTFAELLRMPLHERSKWLSQMSFEVDVDELREWDEATGADGLDDDD